MFKPIKPTEIFRLHRNGRLWNVFDKCYVNFGELLQHNNPFVVSMATKTDVTVKCIHIAKAHPDLKKIEHFMEI